MALTPGMMDPAMWRQMLQQKRIGPPKADMLKQLLMQQKRTGRLPVEGLRTWQIGRRGAGMLQPNPGRRFFDSSSSRSEAGGAVGGFFNQYPDDPSAVGDTSNSPMLGGGPPEGPTTGVPYTQPELAAMNSPLNQPGPNGYSPTQNSMLGSSPGATLAQIIPGYQPPSSMVNPGAQPDTRQAELDALARYLQNINAAKAAQGGTGGGRMYAI